MTRSTLLLALLFGCASSNERDEPVVGEDAISDCIVGLWVRPPRECECFLETPECASDACQEMGTTAFRADGSSMQVGLTFTEGEGSTFSALAVSRGDWLLEGGELSQRLGPTSLRTSLSITCSPSEIVWGGTPWTRAVPAIEAALMERWDQDSWQGVAYSPAR